ncbi:MAG: PEP-CTERM sorting domain-containing protein [Betaproteobacteria bacterium]
MKRLPLLLLLLPLYSRADLWTVHATLKADCCYYPVYDSAVINGWFSTATSGEVNAWNIDVATSYQGVRVDWDTVFTNSRPCLLPIPDSDPWVTCGAGPIPGGFEFGHNVGPSPHGAWHLDFTASNGVLNSGHFTCCAFAPLVLVQGTLVSTPIPEPAAYLLAGIGLLGLYTSLKRSASRRDWDRAFDRHRMH